MGRKKSVKKQKKQFLKTEDFINQLKETYGDKYDYSKTKYVNPSTKVVLTCPIHGEFVSYPHRLLHRKEECPLCSNLDNSSIGQNEITDFIIGLGFNVLKNYSLSNGREIDIYIPDLNIGIEYNGLFWHSETHRPNNYHRDKTRFCNNIGIRLIHIFEDEWEFKQDIVKSRISSILGKNDNKIYARNCDVMEISNGVASKFINRNHIQGNAISKYRYGLFHNNKLVAVMTFCKLRKNLTNKKYKQGYYELLRFCTKKGINVVGGASKLLKYFIKNVNPHHIVSYADVRWTEGDVYKKMGFKWICNTRPNYYYIVDKKRENSFKYRKSELVKQGFDKNRSEHEIMLERKIYRIYDCGTMVFEMKI